MIRSTTPHQRGVKGQSRIGFLVLLLTVAASMNCLAVDAFQSTVTSALSKQHQLRRSSHLPLLPISSVVPMPNTFQQQYRHAGPSMHTSSTALTAAKLTSLPPDSKNNRPVRLKGNASGTTAVYALILVNLGVFILDKVLRNPLIRQNLYLCHFRWKWWQPLTTCFCHADRGHLSSNLFLLLLFGRSVEDDLGWGGLLLSYAFCGVAASLVSLSLLPRHTVSIGASGAVFGLFAVSTLTKLSWREIFNWRKIVEVAVLGEFVVRQLASELSTAASGGTAGINHVAHLSGAAAGFVMVFGMRSVVNSFESKERSNDKRGRL